jgi:hypothetical protein
MRDIGLEQTGRGTVKISIMYTVVPRWTSGSTLSIRQKICGEEMQTLLPLLATAFYSILLNYWSYLSVVGIRVEMKKHFSVLAKM